MTELFLPACSCALPCQPAARALLVQVLAASARRWSRRASSNRPTAARRNANVIAHSKAPEPPSGSTPKTISIHSRVTSVRTNKNPLAIASANSMRERAAWRLIFSSCHKVALNTNDKLVTSAANVSRVQPSVKPEIAAAGARRDLPGFGADEEAAGRGQQGTESKEGEVVRRLVAGFADVMNPEDVMIDDSLYEVEKTPADQHPPE
jgi:hypothetical protein